MNDEQIFEIWWLHNRHKYGIPPYELSDDDKKELMNTYDFIGYRLEIRKNELRVVLEDIMLRFGEWLRGLWVMKLFRRK